MGLSASGRMAARITVVVVSWLALLFAVPAAVTYVVQPGAVGGFFIGAGWGTAWLWILVFWLLRKEA